MMTVPAITVLVVADALIASNQVNKTFVALVGAATLAGARRTSSSPTEKYWYSTTFIVYIGNSSPIHADPGLSWRENIDMTERSVNRYQISKAHSPLRRADNNSR